MHADSNEGEERSKNQLGLALSGGGLRSATFCLGVLQALNRAKLLVLVDRLSTVSGGGYIGGWLSAYDKFVRDNSTNRQAAFDKLLGGEGANHESPSLRRLRERSNFLTPRLSLLGTDLWLGIAAIVGGAAISLIVAMALIVAAMCLWRLAFHFATIGFWFSYEGTQIISRPSLKTGFACGVGSTVILALWNMFSSRSKNSKHYTTTLAVCGFSTMLFAMSWSWLCGSDVEYAKSVQAEVQDVAAPPRVEKPSGGNETKKQPNSTESRRTLEQVFSFGLVPIATMVVLLAMAQLGAGKNSIVGFEKDGTVEMVQAMASQLGRLGLFHLYFAAAWCLGTSIDISALPNSLAIGGVTLTTAESFRRSLAWLGNSGVEASTGNVVSIIKRYTPQVLAYVLLTIFFIVAAMLVYRSGNWDYLPAILKFGEPMIHWSAMLLIAVIVLIAGCLVSREEYGLHGFYRRRIAETFLTFSDKSDGEESNLKLVDETIGEKPRQKDTEPKKPNVDALDHFICCAANDLRGDTVRGLGLGGRHAVFSDNLLKIDKRDEKSCSTSRRDVETLNDIKVSVLQSAAMTASAAAFNSNMGTISMKLGPVVNFLAAALNLRLGLWVDDELKKDVRLRIPRLLREMLSLTNVDADDDYHLSDGAHFENLALYELLRRRCRYIIVCDCGADPKYLFEDVGTAIRRARTDFGAEVDIDVSALRPGDDGFARQPVVVGTVSYHPTCNGTKPEDQGIIVVIKPTLTGNEPRDVLQYNEVNARFPHETTLDQFYDEAQWESYRRLGFHTALEVFQPVGDRLSRDASDDCPVEISELFYELLTKWYPTSDDLRQRFLSQTSRFDSFLTRLRRSNLPSLAQDLLLPNEFHSPVPPATSSGASTSGNQAGTEPLEQTILMISEMIQIMEDTFVALKLDQETDHPVNVGWINQFRRWAGTTSLQTWWPLLQPIYGLEFQRFANRELDLVGVAPSDWTVEKLKDSIKAMPFDKWLARDDKSHTTGVIRFASRCAKAEFGIKAASAPSNDQGVVFSLVVEAGGRDFEYALRFATSDGDGQLQFAEEPDSIYIPSMFFGTGIEYRFAAATKQLLEKLEPADVDEDRTHAAQQPATPETTVFKASEPLETDSEIVVGAPAAIDDSQLRSDISIKQFLRCIQRTPKAKSREVLSAQTK